MRRKEEEGMRRRRRKRWTGRRRLELVARHWLNGDIEVRQ